MKTASRRGSEAAAGFLAVVLLAAGNARAGGGLVLTPSAATNISESFKMISKGFSASLKFEGFGVSARVMDYHVILTNSVPSPLAPEGRVDYLYHFIRPQIGFDLNVSKYTSFSANFGRDLLDSRAYVADGGFSRWLRLRSYHPAMISLSGGYNSANKMRTMSARCLVGLGRWSKGKWLFYAEGSGYEGGVVKKFRSDVGAGLSMMHQRGDWGIDIGGGGGANGPYGTLSIYRSFMLTH